MVTASQAILFAMAKGFDNIGCMFSDFIEIIGISENKSILLNVVANCIFTDDTILNCQLAPTGPKAPLLNPVCKGVGVLVLFLKMKGESLNW